MFHLGLDIGGTKIEAVLLDSHGEIQLRERRPTRKESDPRTPAHRCEE